MANEQTTGQALKKLSEINPDTLIELADSISVTELDYLDGVTAGTVLAGKAAVVDANKDIGDFRNLDVVNLDAGLSGTAGTVDVFPTTAAKGKLIISATDNTGDTNVTLKNAAHGQATVVTLPDVGLAISYVLQSTAAVTAAEANVLAGATAGTQVASKAVVADANVNIGVVKATALHIGATGSEIQVTATVASLNALVKLSETVAFSAFTDGGGAVGTFNITAGTIPAGATFLSAAVTAITGFAGDTSAVLIIGDGSDTDRYNTGTINVFTTAADGVDAGVPSGVRYHVATKTVTLTVTTGADFTSVSAGSVTVELFYLT